MPPNWPYGRNNYNFVLIRVLCFDYRVVLLSKSYFSTNYQSAIFTVLKLRHFTLVL